MRGKRAKRIRRSAAIVVIGTNNGNPNPGIERNRVTGALEHPFWSARGLYRRSKKLVGRILRRESEIKMPVSKLMTTVWNGIEVARWK